MKKATSALPAPSGGRRYASWVSALKLGPSPLPAWVSIVIAVFVTVSAIDDFRLFIQPDVNHPHSWLPLAGTALYWLVWMALAFRPKYTVLGFLIMLILMFPQIVLGGPLLMTFGAIAIGAFRASTRSLVVMVGSFLIWQLMWIPFVSGLDTVQLWAYFLVTLLLTTPGFTIKLMLEKAIRVEQAQKFAEDTAASAAAEQRAELARELHDVVTHGLTMIAVQANLGTITSDSGGQRHALDEIGTMARNSLDDLRRLLKTMRAEETPEQTKSALLTGVEPSPAAIDLAQSVANTQRRLNGLGCPTTVSTAGELNATPNGLRSTVQRFLQECGTNVVKHSGNDTKCEISIAVSEGSIQLVMRNLMTSGKPRLPVSGTGLAGLRERVSRLGGTLDAGPDNDWWSVRTILPFKEQKRLP